MTVAKLVELSTDSPKGFEDAVRTGVELARHTLGGVRAISVEEREIRVGDDGLMTYRVHMMITVAPRRRPRRGRSGGSIER